MIRLCSIIVAGLLGLSLAGCYVYEPVPAYSTATALRAKYDRSWNAALGAMEDNGVTISQADLTTGWIRGKRNNGEVGIHVGQSPDGTVRVQIDTKNIAKQDEGLSDRLTQAYNRRMGR